MLLLMQLGGRLTYFGRLGFESGELIAYLEAQPGVAPIKPGYNPATWCEKAPLCSATPRLRRGHPAG